MSVTIADLVAKDAGRSQLPEIRRRLGEEAAALLRWGRLIPEDQIRYILPTRGESRCQCSMSPERESWGLKRPR